MSHCLANVTAAHTRPYTVVDGSSRNQGDYIKTTCMYGAWGMYIPKFIRSGCGASSRHFGISKMLVGNCKYFCQSISPPSVGPIRSIPIVSKQDFTHPSTGSLSNHTCGVGNIAWNTVAASPFASQVSVDSWQELPALLERLQHEPDNYINKLQVMVSVLSSAPRYGPSQWRFGLLFTLKGDRLPMVHNHACTHRSLTQRFLLCPVREYWDVVPCV